MGRAFLAQIFFFPLWSGEFPQAVSHEKVTVVESLTNGSQGVTATPSLMVRMAIVRPIFGKGDNKAGE